MRTKRKNNRKKLAQRRLAMMIVIILALIAIIAVVKIKNSNKMLLSEESLIYNEENVEQSSNQELITKENEEIIFNEEAKENTIKEQVNKNTEETNTALATSSATTSTLKNGLPVLMYHFFYDKNESTGQDNNFMEISDFEAQMKYLSDNHFYFPTWQEVEDYIDRKISLPEKSIVITVDDGDDSFFELAIPVIQKYNVQATTFVITSWYGYRARDKQANISYQSHSDCMHEGGSNGKGVMLSWSYDKIMEDVKTSSQTLGGATVFCYPFGQYNDLDKQVLKDAGYKLAFTTEGGRVYEGSDKYALPRVRMSKGVSISSFASMVN